GTPVRPGVRPARGRRAAGPPNQRGAGSPGPHGTFPRGEDRRGRSPELAAWPGDYPRLDLWSGGTRMPGGGQPNFKQLMKLQQQLTDPQQGLAEPGVRGTAGGGLVTVTLTAAGDFRSVKIDPKAVDPDDIETLEDLVLAAIHTATEAAREVTEETMRPLNS